MADLDLHVTALMSGKQVGLAPAAARVFPHAWPSLQRALKVMRRGYTELHQAADWLEQLTAILDPEGKPNGKPTSTRSWRRVSLRHS